MTDPRLHPRAVAPSETDGDVLTTVAGEAAWAAGGGSLSVQDEDGTVITGVTQLDFQGAGVTAAAGTGEVVITIPGGGGGGGAAGSLIALKAHNPTTLENKNTTSATDVDADATNLAVTFTAPASGNVLITLSALCKMSAISGYYPVWSIRSGSSTLQRRYVQALGSSISSETTPAVKFYVTGLTPGNSYTYKWGYAVSIAGTGVNTSIYCGGVAGAAVMEVHSAP